MADVSPRTGPIRVTPSFAQSGQRIDRVLAEAIGAISRSRIKALIDEGALSRDYTLTVPEPIPAAPRPEAIPFPILFEDRDLIVIDKPAGLVVHPAPGNQDGTLVNALLAHCGPGFTGIGAEKRPGIVHRLDKDTSGVMVVAKTQLANDGLSAAFAARDLDRAYVALCWGLPNPLAATIEGAIGRDRRDRKRMAVVSHGGKAALTHYKVVRAFGNFEGPSVAGSAAPVAAVALVECRLGTGRTHQIRVHMASAGHPIVGDPVYSRRIPAIAKSLSDAVRMPLLDFPRQALHAASLGFAHPRSRERLFFEAPPPGDMATLLAQLERNLSGN
jgi:23S rRNA pseudouridine1911/1915/1917 synthase